MILTSGLTKRFGPTTAVEDLNLDVREGDIYGFLGANGSGKTTTVRMLMGLVLATSGAIEILGQPMPRGAREVLPQVGALVEGPAAYEHLSGRVNLALFDAMGPRSARTSGRGGRRSRRAARIDDVLAQVGLEPADKRPVRAYSLGMRQRLGLACALLRQPRLLVLDEPTNGLDPHGIREIRELLLGLHAAGTTIFLSSHLLAEVEQLCTRVGVLDRGRLVLQDELSDLLRPSGLTVVRTPDVALACRELGHQVVRRTGETLLVNSGLVNSGLVNSGLVAADPDGAGLVDADPADLGSPGVAQLNHRLVTAGVRVVELAPERRMLEDIVLNATERFDVKDVPR
ncbi:MAG: ABC transporter ATP-binding protein [Nocardioides sp.]